MSIKIKGNYVPRNGEVKFEVTEVKATRKEYLPEGYTDGYPFAYLQVDHRYKNDLKQDGYNLIDQIRLSSSLVLRWQTKEYTRRWFLNEPKVDVVIHRMVIEPGLVITLEQLHWLRCQLEHCGRRLCLLNQQNERAMRDYKDKNPMEIVI